MKGHIVAACGSCRSGKTTYSKKWLSEQMEKKIPSLVIDTDLIRLNLHGHRYAKEAEQIVHSLQDLNLRTFYNAGYHIFLAETCTTPQSIRKVYHVDPNAEFVVFLETTEELYARAINTYQEDLLPVIDRHCLQLMSLKNYKTYIRQSLDEYNWYVMNKKEELILDIQNSIRMIRKEVVHS